MTFHSTTTCYPPIDARYAETMSRDPISWNSVRTHDLDPASRYHSPPQYPLQRQSAQPIPFRPTQPRVASNGRSYSRSSSRPTSSHGLDDPPPLPPASFISLQRQHRRKSSSTRESTGKLSRKSKYWPPDGYDKRSILDEREAASLIDRGACTYDGFAEPISNAAGHSRFFAVMETESPSRTDRATFEHDAFRDITLTILGRKDHAFASLEQPCMASCFGKSPGTTTLTYFVGKSGSLLPPIHYGSIKKARKIKLINILERLKELETWGLQEEDLNRTYKYLYEKLIHDADAEYAPHYDRSEQIVDLLTVLTNPDWTDFSSPRNQVVAKFFDSADEKVKRKFFHQLLLAVELHLRIEAPEHEEAAKRQLLAVLPPKVAWDLALAARWLEHMAISRVQLSQTQSTFTFVLESKKRQKEALHTFASLLKWPNMEEIDYILEEKDKKEKSIEDRSADAMSWFTGVILPGPTLPWLLMNTLIDCDRDTGDSLKYLTHIHPNSGFQYRANTYWSHECIVGKVLGAGRGVRQVAGWIGPCHYAPELERAQCLIIRQNDSLDPPISVKDLEGMKRRTSTLGPETEHEEYPVSEYDLLVPRLDDVNDIIRIEKLSFNPVCPVGDRGTDFPSVSHGAETFDAAIVFAFAGSSLPIKLRYNVDFIYAFPCIGGPHPLYHGYRHKIVRVDEGLQKLKGWAHPKTRNRGSGSRSRDPFRSQPTSPRLYSQSAEHGLEERLAIEEGFLGEPRTMALTLRQQNRDRSRSLPRSRSGSPFTAMESHAPVHSTSGLNGKKYPEEVLVIEAFGVSDNEVFARAWCAQWGRSAVVARVYDHTSHGSPKQGSPKSKGHSPKGSGSTLAKGEGTTCIACAVREAVAAGVSVVILTKGGKREEEDIGIDIGKFS
ncbi:hypothetical protein FKW77_005075 [Venturia effusa]|uniref:Uncharacterized protein n=1 Tax=Venturia effusa TaxID=50376 RepID=A0A517LMT4_9PEZI|nr:hypothetical protein FKW77_005075 [Venturia effusa]